MSLSAASPTSPARGVTVLAERALPRSEMTQEIMEGLVAEAREAHDKVRRSEDAPQDAADATAKFLADLVAAGEHINLPVSSRAPAP
jgi:F-type H+-transporting ATPase subunit epsilon